MRKIPDRSSFTAQDIITDVWKSLKLPPNALSKINLPGSGPGLPSSFKVGLFAQSSIALSALSAALVRAARNGHENVPGVSVPLAHACAEFASERHLLLDGKKSVFTSWPVGGLHRVADGVVRVHDGFPQHRSIALELLGLRDEARREEIDLALNKFAKLQFEELAMKDGAVVSALRSFEEWDATEQAAAIIEEPVQIKPLRGKTALSSLGLGKTMENKLGPTASLDKCLQGVRVLDFSRVLAAPVAGRALAAHGADVLWITAPHLPDLPDCDRDTARGKRSIQLDLRTKKDRETMKELMKEADVVLQGYRPGALAARGLQSEELVKINPSIICANLCAWGTNGPWKARRGFDSIVQTASGLNVAEALAYGDGSDFRVLPCQALDHGSGYMLATGICAALYKREKEGGAWIVDVSLAGTGKYLRSLGQYLGHRGFDCELISDEEVKHYQETRMSGLGNLTALKHSASIDGVEVGWDLMPEPLGSDDARWLRLSGCDV